MIQAADAMDEVAGAIRYAGVLAVWCALLLVRPGLALEILRERRADSPLVRFGRFGFARPRVICTVRRGEVVNRLSEAGPQLREARGGAGAAARTSALEPA